MKDTLPATISKLTKWEERAFLNEASFLAKFVKKGKKKHLTEICFTSKYVKFQFSFLYYANFKWHTGWDSGKITLDEFLEWESQFNKAKTKTKTA